MSSQGPSTPNHGPLTGAVDVFVDATGHLGELSYTVPAGTVVHVGDGVEVPFGKASRTGTVTGPGDPSKATREITEVTGPRSHQVEVELARHIAQRHFCEFSKIAPRLSATSGRGFDAIEAGPVKLAEGPDGTALGYPFALLSHPRRLLLSAPGVDTLRVAALEATNLAKQGQVLVLCPTRGIAAAMAKQFTSGAARLDGKHRKGDLSGWRAFAEGTLQIGIGTRAAVLWAAPDLAGIIVVDEDHPGHVEAAMPHTSAANVAAQRATARGCELVMLGRVATAAALGADVKVGVVGDPARDWPTFEVVDIKNYPPSQRLLPPEVERALEREWNAGRVPVMVTPSSKTTIRCALCKLERDNDGAPCKRCSATEVHLIGTGPERVTAMFRNPVEAVSMGGMRQASDANLVVVMNLDAAHHISSLVPDRPAASVLVEAARIAGPDGRVIVCTDDDKHPVVSDIARMRDLSRNARRTWQVAAELGLPPHGRLVTIRLGRETPPNTSILPGQVLGPRRDGTDWEVLVRIPDAELHTLAKPIEALRRGGKLRVTVS